MSQTPEKDCALILMCKRPQPGIGKQRVADTHGTAVAFVLAKRLLDCALDDLKTWSGPTFIAIAESNDAQWAARQLPGANVVQQGDGNLGKRIRTVSTSVARTTTKQIFIGIDAPTLDAGDYSRAAHALTKNDVVLADADDGGVVLMGCSNGWPDIEPLPWSSDRLGQALHDACVNADLSVVKSDSHADIDFANQFRTLALRIADDPRPSRQALLHWLTQINRSNTVTNAHA